MTWASLHKSAVISFGYPPNWNSHCIKGNENSNKVTKDVHINNISDINHVHLLKDLFSNYGHEISPSSLIYFNRNFTIRMFFEDHDPAHFHVLKDTHSHKSLAKVNIENLIYYQLNQVLLRLNQRF